MLFTILVEFTSEFDIFSFNFYNKHQIGHKFPIVFVFFLKILALLFDVCFDIQLPNSCPFWYSCSAFAIQLQILALFGIFVSFWYSTPTSCPFGILMSFLALLPFQLPFFGVLFGIVASKMRAIFTSPTLLSHLT